MNITDLILIFGIAAVIILLIVVLIRQNKKDDGNTAATEQKIEQKLLHIDDTLSSLKGSTESGIAQLNRSQNDGNARLNAALNQGNEAMLKQQLEQQQKLFATLDQQSTRVNTTLQENIGKLQESNEKKLEQMRVTVDEKMQKTLNERLDSSFKNVSEMLDKLYKSMGEMKNLSTGVTDLQRLLTNVKARGTWAEVQLGEILEQFLTNEQFDRNVSTKHNADFVEYAVKIPSRDNDGEVIWLPIDSKFPQEDYLRLQAAADECDKAKAEECSKAIENVIRTEAAKISKTYINVPKTTNFAIMFLPTEGLYAEVLRRPGLVEEIQRKYNVMICGPTTISAFLNTLRVGFRTIAIDKQQAQVWKILGAAKQQYTMFEAVLDKAEKKITEAGNVIGDAKKRNGIIQKNLRTVENIPQADSDNILGLPVNNTADDVENIQ